MTPLSQEFFCGHKPTVLVKESKKFKGITMKLCAECAEIDCMDD